MIYSVVRYILIASLIGLLSGCHLFSTQTKPAVIVDHKDESLGMVIPLPPKMIATDWNAILTPLVDELLQTTAVSSSNVMLISDVKNSSGHYVSSTTVNKVILDLLSQQDIFTILDKQRVNQSKSQLGIPYDDSLVSRSKMIGLARHLQADYLLFTTINQTPKPPESKAEVTMELLSTKTGEIIWQFSTDQISDDN